MAAERDLFEAVAAGRRDEIESLLREDPVLLRARNEHGDSLLLAAAYAGRQEITDLLIEKGLAADFFEATALGLGERVRSEIEADPSLTRAYSHDGWTALHLAAFFGRRDLAALLIDRGADVDARSRSERFARANTPLHAAAANRQTEVARLLMERGADVNARDGSGFTPLALAANNRNDILVMELLERGAIAG